MRIDTFNQIAQAYSVNNKVKTAAVAKTSKMDEFEISSFGKDLTIAKQAVANSSDIREKRVAELKAQINSGSYEVSGESFADKLIKKYELTQG